MVQKEQDERTCRARSDASTLPFPCPRGHEEARRHKAHTQLEARRSTVTKQAEEEKNTNVFFEQMHHLKSKPVFLNFLSIQKHTQTSKPLTIDVDKILFTFDFSAVHSSRRISL